VTLCKDCVHWNITGWAHDKASAEKGNCNMMLRPDLCYQSPEWKKPKGSMVKIFSNCRELPVFCYALTPREFGCVLGKTVAEVKLVA